MDKLAFLPKATLNMDQAIDPEREAKELQEADSFDEYVEEREFHSNSGHLEFRSEAKYRDCRTWLSSALPLTVPTYVSTKAGATCVDALTRPEELKLGPLTATIVELHCGDSNIFESAFMEAFTEEFASDNEEDGDEYDYMQLDHDCAWKTIGIIDGFSPLGPSKETVMNMDDDTYAMYYEDFKDTVPLLVSNVLPGHKGSAILLSDLIRVALRKRRAEAFERLLPVMMTEKRPLTTKVGRVLHTSRIFEPRVFELIGAYLM